MLKLIMDAMRMLMCAIGVFFLCSAVTETPMDELGIIIGTLFLIAAYWKEW